MQVATDDPALHGALGLVLAVIAVPDDDGPERLRARAEVRPPGVVLEPDEIRVGSVDEEVPDEARVAGACRHVENPDAGNRRPSLGKVLVTQELVPATHREDRRTAVHGLLERGAVPSSQVSADDVLALVLAAAEEPDVGPIRVGPLADRIRTHLGVDPAPLRPLAERDDVPAVAINVHEVGIEMGDPQIHRAQSSQNGVTAPTRESAARSSSIAV